MADSRLSEIRAKRLEKLEKIKSLGVNPYTAVVSKDLIKISSARKKAQGEKVIVAGRVWGWREHGNSVFADLRDETDKIQVFIQKKELGDKYDLVKLIDTGDFLEVKGKIFTTNAGEITINVSELRLLTKSIRPLPSVWYGLTDIEERYRQRYVDILLNPDVKRVFDTRTKLLREIRKYMDDSGFSEVETPVLQPIYGGASAQPFITHHNSLDSDFYLRISDELFLKRLIVGGYEKVYEIGHIFRNEGMDRAHNPEFTMMEFYWAYADYEKLMDFSQEMLSDVIKKVIGTLKIKYEDKVLDFTPPWPRKTYREMLLEGVGIDINDADTEDKLTRAIKDKKLKLDLKGVVGYGALCDKLYKEYVRPKIIQPTYLLDYPAEMIALAKRKETDPKKIASFQLLANGYELIKAYNELNDPLDQKERWLEEEKLAGKGLKDHMVVDEDYLRALEYGMPPTAGWGMGIDRLTAILTDQHSLKDTIIFPTLRPGR